MIIWLASYPKSRSILVRLFLDCLFNFTSKLSINKNTIKQFPLRYSFKVISENINDQYEE